MKVIVNGDSVEISDGASVATLVESLGLPGKGIAVAVDWSVRTSQDPFRLPIWPR